MELHFTFATIAIAIIKLFILMAIGYGLYRIKLIDDNFVDKLSLLLIRLFFPALIIAKTITHFSFSEYPHWWLLPVCAIILSAAGVFLGQLVYTLLRGKGPHKEFLCSSAFQNCGYLPMTLILFAFTGEMSDRLLIYMFLFIMGFNLLMWSLVPLFLSGKLKSEFNLKTFFNPPVAATLFSILWVALAGKGSLPQVLMDPIRHLGYAAFPVSMLVLGAYLARYQAYKPQNNLLLAATISVKLFIVPLLVLGVLYITPLGYDYKFFIFLQAIMPTAVSLVIIGSYTGADNSFLSSSIFYTHLIAIVSIPIWLAVFNFVLR